MLTGSKKGVPVRTMYAGPTWKKCCQRTLGARASTVRSSDSKKHEHDNTTMTTSTRPAMISRRVKWWLSLFGFSVAVPVIRNLISLSYSHQPIVIAEDVQPEDWMSNAPLSNVSSEFDYPLTCRQPPRILSYNRTLYQVALVYHVGMLHNWKEVVTDQLTTLYKCGLGTIASSFTVTYSNGNSTDLRQVLHPFPFARKAQLIPAYQSPWEEQAMLATSRLCANATYTSQQPSHPTIVFYFHSKGTSKYHHDWRYKLNTSWSYSRSLYWRKFMEYYTLERPHLCLNKIVHEGAKTCGIMIKHVGDGWHYSGTFWAASCDYINSMRPINSTWCRQVNMEYNCAEFWIGSGMQDTLEERKFVDLHPGFTTNLYDNLVLPDTYHNDTL